MDRVQATPLSPEELLENLACACAEQPLTKMLSLDTLYRMVLHVPGVIIRRDHGARRAPRTPPRHPHSTARRVQGLQPAPPAHRLRRRHGFPTSPTSSGRARSAVAGRFPPLPTATRATCATCSIRTSRANTSAPSGSGEPRSSSTVRNQSSAPLGTFLPNHFWPCTPLGQRTTVTGRSQVPDHQ
jgi:hypothetical protein